MSKITPFLWFNDNAEEAVNFYVATFPDSGVDEVRRYGAGGQGSAGQVMTMSFHLADREFIALNGGPHYQLTPAISMFIDCEDQAEVDRLWETLVAGGAPSRCGWLTDRFGLSWQVIPRQLGQMLGDSDPARAGRVMQAMMKMIKIDIAVLQRAYDGDKAA